MPKLLRLLRIVPSLNDNFWPLTLLGSCDGYTLRSIIIFIFFTVYNLEVGGKDAVTRVLLRLWLRRPIESGKKVKHYYYNYVDEVGRGNFSKVYKGLNTKTRTFISISE